MENIFAGTLLGLSLVLVLAIAGPLLFELFRYKYIVEPEIIAKELAAAKKDNPYCDCKEKDWECDDSMGYRLRCKKCGKEPSNE